MSDSHSTKRDPVSVQGGWAAEEGAGQQPAGGLSRSDAAGPGASAGDCDPASVGCACTGNAPTAARSQTGVAVSAYEYRRLQTGAQPLWTPPRFPGQYHDAKTDLFENWNRYYDPSAGRYLQPEPLQEDPESVKGMAQQGLSTPAYAYALNNPMRFVDPTGENPINPACAYMFNKHGLDLTTAEFGIGVGDAKAHRHTTCLIAQLCGTTPSSTLNSAGAWDLGLSMELLDGINKAHRGVRIGDNIEDGYADVDSNTCGVDPRRDDSCAERCRNHTGMPRPRVKKY
ncbi:MULTISPECIES: RHS repeat-associated core domain-containing protein [Myxococcus]|uniref:RHS repeat-associated core domain-containing protein n=1 Tax=Myxococcus TaxID=32 RepID=UPI0011425FAB|nr:MULTISPECIES: RHS repeat-associated core domain-containing protein [Myxococcus]NOK02250.1 RHS repeat-associated core domain-containing protein [Myxococcus xanthus]